MKFHLWLIMAVGAQVSAVHSQDRAMLRMQMISGFEELAKTTKDEDRKRSAEAMITVLFRELEILMKKEEYAQADEWARIYLDREKTGFTKHSAKVGLLFAESLGKQGMEEDAIVMYGKIWPVHMGDVSVSAPAITRWMELLWSRDKPADGERGRADRQAAYEEGFGYIELTSRFQGKLNEEELEFWKRVKNLVQVYEADPEIKAIRGIEEIKRGKWR